MASSVVYMVEQYIHIYEKIPLPVAGICMGLALLLGHLVAVVKPRLCMDAAAYLCSSVKWGQALFTVDIIWIALLLWDSPVNPLRMELFDFTFARGMLLLACPIVWYTLCTYSRVNLFGRSLGLFLLLLGIVPLSAAYLKEPATRVLIPLWWYPVLTASILWVAMPYLLRDWVNWLRERPLLVRLLALAGAVYGGAVLGCAILYWS